jgi:predicted Abi (CAAX) family protease
VLFFTTVFANSGLNKFDYKDSYSFDSSKLSLMEIVDEKLDMVCTTYRVVHDCNGDGTYDYDYTGCFDSFNDARALAIQFSNSCGQQ